MQHSIGVFDSGFGGLTILRGLVKELPEYNYIYLGDTARAPYGTRSQEVIYEYTKQAVDLLFKQNCSLIILACNTASSEALAKIQREYLPKHYPDRRVLGVLIPAAEAAVEHTKTKRIGVIATESTVQSEAFVRELIKLDPKIDVSQQACPLLVPFIECGEESSKALNLVLEKYLQLIKKKVDTLILGCTHYGLLEKKIQKIVGKNVRLISEEKIVPKKVQSYLKRHPEIEKELSKKGKVLFYSTDLTKKFAALGTRFFGKKIIAKQIHL